jgi:hypothetical protein
VRVCCRGICCDLASAKKAKQSGRALWLTAVIPATREAGIRKIAVRSQPQQIVLQTLSRKTLYKKGLVEWLKVKALSSNPSTARKKKKSAIGRVFCFFLHSQDDGSEQSSTFSSKQTRLYSNVLEQIKS